MADCTKHDDVVNELAKIKERLSATEQTVSDGWMVIRENKGRIDTLERSTERVEEKTNSIFRLLKDLTNTIQSMDDKLDEYIKDIRLELKETNREVSDLKTKQAVTTNNIQWNWKTILASGTVITFLVGMIGQVLLGV